VASELIRCSTSIGANAEEAQDGQTKPDYIAKMSVSRKESRETIYWLRLGLRAKVVTQEEVAWEPFALSPEGYSTERLLRYTVPASQAA
jgi:four helix bundle protein